MAGATCMFGGFIAYMQLGVSLSLHANLQPYVANYFFGKQASKSVDETYTGGMSHFKESYGVYCLCIIGMLIGLPLGKKLLKTEPNASYQSLKIKSPRIIYFINSATASLMIFATSYVQADATSNGFLFYALMMGLSNGLFSGVAY